MDLPGEKSSSLSAWVCCDGRSGGLYTCVSSEPRASADTPGWGVCRVSSWLCPSPLPTMGSFTIASSEQHQQKQNNILSFFFYFWLCWVFVAARGLSLVAASGGYSSWWCAGFSLRWLLLLHSTGSRHAGFSSCGTRALERRLSSCDAWAYLLRGMWDLPRPGLEPVCPALAGGFLTTAPPWKSQQHSFLNEVVS